MVDFEQCCHLFNGVVDEICSLIADQNLKTSKTSDDVLIKKNGSLLNIGLFERLGLSLLGQVLNSHDNIFVPLR
jgi:hypothetical protein